MNRFVLYTCLAFASAPAAAATLADVKHVYLDLTLPEILAECRGDFERNAAKEHVSLLSREKADAVLKVNIAHEEKSARHILDWNMSLTLKTGQQALAESGKESGWTAMGACSDLAEDMMEDLRDDLKRARFDQFR